MWIAVLVGAGKRSVMIYGTRSMSGRSESFTGEGALELTLEGRKTYSPWKRVKIKGNYDSG